MGHVIMLDIRKGQSDLVIYNVRKQSIFEKEIKLVGYLKLYLKQKYNLIPYKFIKQAAKMHIDKSLLIS